MLALSLNFSNYSKKNFPNQALRIFFRPYNNFFNRKIISNFLEQQKQEVAPYKPLPPKYHDKHSGHPADVIAAKEIKMCTSLSWVL